MQSCRIHHDEHGAQAAPWRAHDPTGGRVKAHDASGAAVQAHFFFDAVAIDGTARAIGIKLGHQKQRQALRAGRRIGQARQHQVNDVVAQIMLATGDENLGAAELITAVSLRYRLGAGQAQVAACVRFGQAHGAQPFAGGDFAQVAGFEFIAAVVD